MAIGLFRRNSGSPPLSGDGAIKGGGGGEGAFTRIEAAAAALFLQRGEPCVFRENANCKWDSFLLGLAWLAD